MSQPTPKSVMSTKGQLIVPKGVRDRQGWRQGVRLEFVETPQGVLVRQDKREDLFPPTRMEDVFGMLKYDGPPVSVEDMKAAVRDAAVERYERSLRSSGD